MYFEDFDPDQVYETPSREITGADIDAFIKLSGLNLPMFQGDAGAQAVGHDRRLAPGPMLLSIAMGLVFQTGLFDQVKAVAEFDNLRFHWPAHPGDEVRAKVTVLQTRATKRPDRGLVLLKYEMLRASGEVILTAEATYLIGRRPEPGQA